MHASGAAATRAAWEKRTAHAHAISGHAFDATGAAKKTGDAIKLVPNAFVLLAPTPTDDVYTDDTKAKFFSLRDSLEACADKDAGTFSAANSYIKCPKRRSQGGRAPSCCLPRRGLQRGRV